MVSHKASLHHNTIMLHIYIHFNVDAVVDDVAARRSESDEKTQHSDNIPLLTLLPIS